MKARIQKGRERWGQRGGWRWRYEGGERDQEEGFACKTEWKRAKNQSERRKAGKGKGWKGEVGRHQKVGLAYMTERRTRKKIQKKMAE